MPFTSEEFAKAAKEKKMSFAKIASELGVSRATTAKWARGASKPDGRYMTKLEKILGVKPGEWGGSALNLDLTKLSPEQRIEILDHYALLEVKNDNKPRTIGEFEVGDQSTVTYEIVEL